MVLFFDKLRCSSEVKALLSEEHFSEDATLLQDWASHASLEHIDGKDPPLSWHPAHQRDLSLHHGS